MPENISFYKGKKEALSATSGTHIDKYYEIISDKDEGGKRVITLQEKDMSSHTANVKALVDELLAQLGETESRLMKTMLLDHLKDYKESDVIDMLRKVRAGAKVKPSEGCFKIIIGDGRKKKSHTIQLVD